MYHIIYKGINVSQYLHDFMYHSIYTGFHVSQY